MTPCFFASRKDHPQPMEPPARADMAFNGFSKACLCFPCEYKRLNSTGIASLSSGENSERYPQLNGC